MSEDGRSGDDSLPLLMQSPYWNSIRAKNLGTVEIDNLITIKTNFDPLLKENTHFPTVQKGKANF
jgi:hypothetical protein